VVQGGQHIARSLLNRTLANVHAGPPSGSDSRDLSFLRERTVLFLLLTGKPDAGNPRNGPKEVSSAAIYPRTIGREDQAAVYFRHLHYLQRSSPANPTTLSGMA